MVKKALLTIFSVSLEMKERVVVIRSSLLSKSFLTVG